MCFRPNSDLVQPRSKEIGLLNVAPLNLAPQYALPGQGGLSERQYWHDKPSNLTAVSFAMQKQVVSVNVIFLYEVEHLAQELKGSEISVLDVHGLVSTVPLALLLLSSGG